MAWTAPRTYVTAELITGSILNTDIRDNLREVLHIADSGTFAGTTHGNVLFTSASLTFNGTDQALLLVTTQQMYASSGAGALGYVVDADLYWNALLVKAAVLRGVQTDTGTTETGGRGGHYLWTPAAATGTVQMKVNGTSTAEGIGAGWYMILRKGTA